MDLCYPPLQMYDDGRQEEEEVLDAYIARCDAVDDAVSALVVSAPAMSVLFAVSPQEKDATLLPVGREKGSGRGRKIRSSASSPTHALSAYGGPLSNGLSKEECSMMPYLTEGSSASIDEVLKKRSTNDSTSTTTTVSLMKSYLKLSRLRRLLMSGLIHHSAPPSSPLSTTTENNAIVGHHPLNPKVTVVGTLIDPHFDHVADMAAKHLIAVHQQSSLTTATTTSNTGTALRVDGMPHVNGDEDDEQHDGVPLLAPPPATTAPTDLDNPHTAVLVESLVEFCSAPLFAPYCLVHYDLSPTYSTVYRGATAYTTTDSGGISNGFGTLVGDKGGGTADACESTILHLAPALASQPSLLDDCSPSRQRGVAGGGGTTATVMGNAIAGTTTTTPSSSSAATVGGMPALAKVPLRPGQRPLSLIQESSREILHAHKGKSRLPYYATSKDGLDSAQGELCFAATHIAELQHQLQLAMNDEEVENNPTSSSSSSYPHHDNTADDNNPNEIRLSMAALQQYVGSCQRSILSPSSHWDPIASTFLGEQEEGPSSSLVSIDSGTFHLPLLESIMMFLARVVSQACVGASMRVMNTAVAVDPSSSSLTQRLGDHLMLTDATPTSCDPLLLSLAHSLLDNENSSGSGNRHLLSAMVKKAHTILCLEGEEKDGVDSTTSCQHRPQSLLGQLALDTRRAKRFQRILHDVEEGRYQAIHGSSQKKKNTKKHTGAPKKSTSPTTTTAKEEEGRRPPSLLSTVNLLRISDGPGGLALQATVEMVSNLLQRQQRATAKLAGDNKDGSASSCDADSIDTAGQFDVAVDAARYKAFRIKQFASLFNAREWKKAIHILMTPDNRGFATVSSWDACNCLGVAPPGVCTGIMVAQFLYDNRHALDRQVIGDYIGELGKECREVSDKDLRAVFEPFLDFELSQSPQTTTAADNNSESSVITSSKFTTELVRARWDEEFAIRYPMSIQFMDILLKGFLACFQFTLKPLLQSIREVVHEVGLPGESQKIDRVMEAFALQWSRDNSVPPALPSTPPVSRAVVPPTTMATNNNAVSSTATNKTISPSAIYAEGNGTNSNNSAAAAAVRRYNDHRAALLEVNPFKGTDAAFILSFSLIMLNTDHHSGKLAKKMSLPDFRSMNRGIDEGGASLPEAFLTALYYDIESSQIVMLDHAAKHTANIQKEVTEELKEAVIVAGAVEDYKGLSLGWRGGGSSSSGVRAALERRFFGSSSSAAVVSSSPLKPQTQHHNHHHQGDELVHQQDGNDDTIAHPLFAHPHSQLLDNTTFLALAASSRYSPEGRDDDGASNGLINNSNSTNKAPSSGPPLSPQAQLELAQQQRAKEVANSIRVLYNTTTPTATSNAHLLTNGHSSGGTTSTSGGASLMDKLLYSTTGSRPLTEEDTVAALVDPHLLQTIWQPSALSFLTVFDTILSVLRGLNEDACGGLLLQMEYLALAPPQQAEKKQTISTLMDSYVGVSKIWACVSKAGDGDGNAACGGGSASSDLCVAIKGLMGLVDASLHISNRKRSSSSSSGKLVVPLTVVSSILLSLIEERILPRLREAVLVDDDVSSSSACGSPSPFTHLAHLTSDPHWLLSLDLAVYLLGEIHERSTTQSSLLSPPVLQASAEMYSLLHRCGHNALTTATTTPTDNNAAPTTTPNSKDSKGMIFSPLRALAVGEGTRGETSHRRQQLFTQRRNTIRQGQSSTNKRSQPYHRKYFTRRHQKHRKQHLDDMSEDETQGGGGWLSGLWGRSTTPASAGSNTHPNMVSPTGPHQAALLNSLRSNNNNIYYDENDRHLDNNNHHLPTTANASSLLTSDNAIQLLCSATSHIHRASSSPSSSPPVSPVSRLLLPYLVKRATTSLQLLLTPSDSSPDTTSRKSTTPIPDEVVFEAGLDTIELILSATTTPQTQQEDKSEGWHALIQSVATSYLKVAERTLARACSDLFAIRDDHCDNGALSVEIPPLVTYLAGGEGRRKKDARGRKTLESIYLGEVVSQWKRLGSKAHRLAINFTAATAEATAATVGPTKPSSSYLYSNALSSPSTIARLLIGGGNHQENDDDYNKDDGGEVPLRLVTIQQLVWPALLETLMMCNAEAYLSTAVVVGDDADEESDESIQQRKNPLNRAALRIADALRRGGSTLTQMAKTTKKTATTPCHTASSPLVTALDEIARELSYVSIVAIANLVLAPSCSSSLRKRQHSSNSGDRAAVLLPCTCGDANEEEIGEGLQLHHPEGLNDEPTTTITSPLGSDSPHQGTSSPPCARCTLVRAALELLSTTIPTALEESSNHDTTTTEAAGGAGGPQQLACGVMYCAEALAVLVCAATIAPRPLGYIGGGGNIAEMCVVGLQRCLLTTTAPSLTSNLPYLFDRLLFPVLDLMSTGSCCSGTNHHTSQEHPNGGEGGEEEGAAALLSAYHCCRRTLNLHNNTSRTSSPLVGYRNDKGLTPTGSVAAPAISAQASSSGRLTGFFSPTAILSSVFGPMAGPHQQQQQPPPSSSSLQGDNGGEDDDVLFNTFSRTVSMMYRVFTHWAPQTYTATTSTQQQRDATTRTWKRLLGICFALSSSSVSTTLTDNITTAASLSLFPPGAVDELVEVTARNALSDLRLLISSSDVDAPSSSPAATPKQQQINDDFWRETTMALSMFTWFKPPPPSQPTHPPSDL